MTKGRILWDGKTMSLELDGHASGSEAVCAGVSAIVGALAGYLVNHISDMASPPVIRLDSGKARIRVQHPDLRLQTAFDMAEIGLLQTAEQYPEYLKMKILRKEGPTGP